MFFFLKTKKQKIQILTDRIAINTAHLNILIEMINSFDSVTGWLILDTIKLIREIAKDEQLKLKLKLKLINKDFKCKT